LNNNSQTIEKARIASAKPKKEAAGQYDQQPLFMPSTIATENNIP